MLVTGTRRCLAWQTRQARAFCMRSTVDSSEALADGTSPCSMLSEIVFYTSGVMLGQEMPTTEYNLFVI